MEQHLKPGDPPLGWEVRSKAAGIILVWMVSSYTQGQLALMPIPDTWNGAISLIAFCLFVNLINMCSGAFTIIYLFIEWAEYDKAVSRQA